MAGQTVLPNLRAAGADLTKIKLLDRSRFIESPLLLPGDIPVIEQAVVELQAKLVVIDPFTAFLAGNSNGDAAVRKALGPLSVFAEKYDLAVLIVRHLRKSGAEQSALRRPGQHWHHRCRPLRPRGPVRSQQRRPTPARARPEQGQPGIRRVSVVPDDQTPGRHDWRGMAGPKPVHRRGPDGRRGAMIIRPWRRPSTCCTRSWLKARCQPRNASSWPVTLGLAGEPSSGRRSGWACPRGRKEAAKIASGYGNYRTTPNCSSGSRTRTSPTSSSGWSMAMSPVPNPMVRPALTTKIVTVIGRTMMAVMKSGLSTRSRTRNARESCHAREHNLTPSPLASWPSDGAWPWTECGG